MSREYDDDIIAAIDDLNAHIEYVVPVEKALFDLTSAAVSLIDGVDCADVLIIENDDFNSLAPTSPVATIIDLAQRDTGQGPCLDAAERDVIVRCNDLRDDGRWPAFAK
jgi:hypothetical protein